MEHTEENIADADLDIHDKPKEELIDNVLTFFDIQDLPTGSLIVSRGTCFTILYHGNDMNCHISILVWCPIEGDELPSLYYVPGKTKPMIFGLDTYLYKQRHPVIMAEIGSVLRDREYAYRPRQQFMTHPRYLEVIAKLIRVIPLVYLDNDIGHMCRHKWQPTLFSDPETIGFAKTRDLYSHLVDSGNYLAEGLRNIKQTSSTCVDSVTLFISLLHKDLYELENPILSDVKDYDAARLLRPGSPLYELYEDEAIKYSSAVYTKFRGWNCAHFFEIYALNIFIFFVICSIFYFAFGRNTALNSTHHARYQRIRDLRS